MDFLDYFIIFGLGWIFFGILAGLVMIVEFYIMGFQLSKKNEKKYLWLGVTFGYIGFLMSIVSIIKTIRKL